MALYVVRVVLVGILNVFKVEPTRRIGLAVVGISLGCTTPVWMKLGSC